MTTGKVVGSNPIGSTKTDVIPSLVLAKRSFIAAVSVLAILYVGDYLSVRLAILYVGDYLSVRLRMIHPKPADPLESLTAPRVLAIQEKNGKIEYQIGAQNPEQTVTCVHSLFPYLGYSPCWYVKPRINQPIPM